MTAVISLATITAAARAATSKTILTVGSGDGSQQVDAVEAGVKHMTCTFMDSEQEVRTAGWPCIEVPISA
jgi:hypothetical protein